MLTTILLLLPLPITCLTPCKDDMYKDCPDRAARGECEGGVDARKGDMHDIARLTLAECRESCRKVLQGKEVSRMVEKYGGLQDVVKDPFGFDYELCGADGGFTSDGRAQLLFQIALNHEQREWVPAFTKVGYEKMKIPSSVWKKLSKDYKRVLPRMRRESCILSVINCQEIQEKGDESFLNDVQRTYMMDLSEDTLLTLKNELQPLAESWASIRLEHTSTYGIRRYTNNSWLVAHVDRLGTHVISAILNVGQKVDVDWPLFIKDNEGGDHQVVLEPGEMIWYESARLVHGRMEHFQGEYYDNIFLHYKPKGDWYSGQYVIGGRPWRGPPVTAEWVRRSERDRGHWRTEL